MAQTFEAEIVRCARNVARLQTRRRRLRREIKKIEVDLKAERKHLKALSMENRDPDVVPSRLFGEGVGHKWHEKGGKEEKPAGGADLGDLEPMEIKDAK